MKLLNLLLALVLLAVCILLPNESAAQDNNVDVLTPKQADKLLGTEYPYFSVYGGRISIRLHGSVMVGDIGVPAKFCSKQSAFYCVNSEALSFAVPKRFEGKNRSWSVSGHRYSVIAPLHYMMLYGKTMRIAVITSMTQDSKTSNSSSIFYFYSPKIGLLGYEIINNDKDSKQFGKLPVMYFLAGDKGFGASLGKP